MAKRNTSQRRAIRDVFDSTDRPLSTQEVLDAAQHHKSGIGIATIYRTLKLLIEEDWLVTVTLPNEPPRYERAGKPHHHHFYCLRCKRAFEVPGCVELLDTLIPPGFVLQGHDLVLNGLCVECAGNTEPGST